MLTKHIEIAHSSIRGLSSMSLISCDAIRATLAKHYTSVCITTVDNLSDLKALIARKPSLVFLGVESIPISPDLAWDDVRRIWIAEYLDEQGIAYTGSGHIAHALGRDKALAKQRVLDCGLNTAAFCVIKQGQSAHALDRSLSFPLFVKPTDRGGGVGIDSESVVYTFEQLDAKVCAIAADLHADALVEEYLPGREFSVAILKEEDSVDFSVMPVELIAPPDKQGMRILSKAVKTLDTEQVKEVTDEHIRAKIMNLAIDAFHALGGRDYGRIDIRLDKSGMPQFLEVNPIPSLIRGYGNFPKACMLNMYLGYEPMLLRIVRLGLARSREETESKLLLRTINC